MKILVAHNRYRQIGGEDSVFKAETKLLKSKGHKVELFEANNEVLNDLFTKIKTALNVAYSKQSKRNIKSKIAIFQPDIIHVHNFFPFLTPSIYDACQESSVPVIQTLHNYRTICSGELLFRNGKTCEICISNSPYLALVHRCYLNSFLGSIVVARMVSYHKKNQTWSNKVARFIALTEFAKNKFLKAGFPSEKILVKPNFYERRPERTIKHRNKKVGALFVGRMSYEKGINTLLHAWNSLDVPLSIAGDGPMFKKIKKNLNSSIKMLGWLNSSNISLEMDKAAFLVMPSECYEMFPLVLVEAFAHGLPAIVSGHGSLSEIVENGVTGLHFKPSDPQDLASKVQWLQDHPSECHRMGVNAQKMYEKKYTPEKNYKMLLNIYKVAIDSYKLNNNQNSSKAKSKQYIIY